MRRREFITVLGGAVTWPLPALAQQPAMPVIGFLRDGKLESSRHLIEPFRRGLAEAGFVEGQNVAVEYSLTDGDRDRLAPLAANLIRRSVSIIVTSAVQAALVAKAATSSTPIVFCTASDPVSLGLVASLARPEGNATGVSYLTGEIGGKRLGLLHELLPTVKEIAILVNPKNASAASQAGFTKDLQEAAHSLGLRLRFLHASHEAEIEAAFATISGQRVGALLLATDPIFTTHRLRIISLAALHSLPCFYAFREFVEDGGLMSYGAPLKEAYRQTGIYAGRILKGEQPADLPVLQSTTFELVINLKSARALRLTFPPGLLAIADEVIE